MHHVYTFFFRLFLTFLAAKLMVTLAGLEGLNLLIGFTLLLLGNVYLFDYLDHRSRTAWRRRVTCGPETGPPLPSAAPETPPET